MKEFLNNYMAANRELAQQNADVLRGIFQATTATIVNSIGPGAFRLRNAVNAAVLDSVMVAVSQLLERRNGKVDTKAVKTAYERLKTKEQYVDAVSRATADEENVRRRLQLAREAFLEVR